MNKTDNFIDDLIDEVTQPVIMTGPAATAFEGETEI